MKNERCVWTCLKTFFSQKLCFVRSCCLEEGRLPLPVWRINFENKCDVCAQAFWWTKSVSEQIRSVHFEKKILWYIFEKKVYLQLFRHHMENSDWTFWLSLNNWLYLIELFNFRAHIENIDWPFWLSLNYWLKLIELFDFRMHIENIDGTFYLSVNNWLKLIAISETTLILIVIDWSSHFLIMCQY